MSMRKPRARPTKPLPLLKTCPGCGAYAVFRMMTTDPHAGCVYIICHACRMQTGIEAGHTSAARVWNKRVDG